MVLKGAWSQSLQSGTQSRIQVAGGQSAGGQSVGRQIASERCERAVRRGSDRASQSTGGAIFAFNRQSGQVRARESAGAAATSVRAGGVQAHARVRYWVTDLYYILRVTDLKSTETRRTSPSNIVELTMCWKDS
jgi:hypothetical protein